jgi:hypothetical protein
LIFLISVFQIARITGMSHQHRLQQQILSLTHACLIISKVEHSLYLMSIHCIVSSCNFLLPFSVHKGNMWFSYYLYAISVIRGHAFCLFKLYRNLPFFHSLPLFDLV